jgi:hypothetical protein
MIDYIPSREADMQLWVINFDTLVTAAPASYGLVAADAVAIGAVVDAFNAALTLARDPATRTKSTVADKNGKKAAMLQVVRSYAMLVKANDGVSDQSKVDLGLRLDDGDPSPIPAPLSWPLLNIVAAGPLIHELRFADSATPDSKAKPPGAASLQLVASVGEAPPAGPETCATKAHASRNPINVSFSSAEAGQTAHYWARWVTQKGLTSPWSQMSSLTIAA